MNIIVIGATGMIGASVVAEAARRGHSVTAISRSGQKPAGAAQAQAIDLSDSAAIVQLINAADVTVISIPPDRSGGSHEPVLKAHRDLIAAKPSGRFLVVGGCRLAQGERRPPSRHAGLPCRLFQGIDHLHTGAGGLSGIQRIGLDHALPGAGNRPRTTHRRVQSGNRQPRRQRHQCGGFCRGSGR